MATLTEIADHARPLWIVAGDRTCLKDGHPVRQRSLDDNLLALAKIPAGTRLMVAAPSPKTSHRLCSRPWPTSAAGAFRAFG